MIIVPEVITAQVKALMSWRKTCNKLLWNETASDIWSGTSKVIPGSTGYNIFAVYIFDYGPAFCVRNSAANLSLYMMITLADASVMTGGAIIDTIGDTWTVRSESVGRAIYLLNQPGTTHSGGQYMPRIMSVTGII
jgi:hypothetical protein